MQKWKSRAEKNDKQITCDESTDCANIEMPAQIVEYARFDTSL
ncbi:hypothetical protein [Scytonema millei]|nr:hypothetical protein [Scytonema millei]